MDLIDFIELSTSEQYPSVLSYESFINPDILTHYLKEKELNLHRAHKNFSIIKPRLKKNNINPENVIQTPLNANVNKKKINVNRKRSKLVTILCFHFILIFFNSHFSYF